MEDTHEQEKMLLIVLDSAGAGEMPDSAEFGDAGADTIGNIIRAARAEHPEYGRAGPARHQGNEFLFRDRGRSWQLRQGGGKTRAKDTTCGHFELAGFIMDKPFKTYPNGFPNG